MSPLAIRTSRQTHKPENLSPKLWLLLLGINQYQDEQLPNLRYSAVDCQKLAEALNGATTQFQEKNLKIHHDFASLAPSLAQVRRSLEEISTAAQPQDTILFYFSGHGILEPSTQQVFLCLTDTLKSDLQNTGLSLHELLQALASSHVRNQLVWLDACHSGGMTLRSAMVEPLLNPTSQLVEILQQRAVKSQDFYALLSCDRNQQSWEFPELGHGIFTYYLMCGLHGEAADSQGLISVDGLYRYVYHRTLQYIDKTNQQLRLINQQKLGKGETEIFSEYSLQTPKRIIEGVGELIIGKKHKNYTQSIPRRVGVVVEGLSASKVTLDISKILSSTGSFKLEYLPASKITTDEVKNAIARHFHSTGAETVLLYLRGRIEDTDAWESLVLGENIRIKRSWLKQQLRQCDAKQIIILDCPAVQTPHIVETRRKSSLKNWIEDLQIDSKQGQCIIACSSKTEETDKFSQTLLYILMASSLTSGLSAAGAIAHLQMSFAGTDISLEVWFSGLQGIIEILPANTQIQKQTVDLGICPYMGLSAFAEDDCQFFYGRESLAQQLTHQIANSSFLAVVGASGSGKSSVVQAGVISQLRNGKQIPNSEQWLITCIRPGANPLEALAKKLGSGEWGMGNGERGILSSPSPTPLLEGILHQGVEGFVYWIRTLSQPMVVLVVDQFEEVFTLASPTERDRFLELLLGAVEYTPDRFKLIITLRADFIASCLEIPKLAIALQQSSVLVPAILTIDDYRRVIINPAQQVGLQVEPELVEVLLRELNNSVGDLPLLEFVLEQLWQHRTEGKLTLEAYQKQLGGFKGALERSSQALYDRLDSQSQECAKWIFLSLTQLGKGTEDTRRRINKSELIVKKFPQDVVERTLQALIAAKLIVANTLEGGVGSGEWGMGKSAKEEDRETEKKNHPPSSPYSPLPTPHSPITIEIAHEILIRHWSTLRWWLSENRARLRSQRQVEQAAQLWKQNVEQPDFLLQGVRLAEAEDIYVKYIDELSLNVRRYIEACLEQRNLEQKKEKIRLKQARFLVVFSVLGIAASGFGGLAYWNSQTAQLREIEALKASAGANLLSNQQLEALISSVQAAKQLKKTVFVSNDQYNLQQVLSQIQERNRLESHSATVKSVAVSPDGKLIASASDDKTVKLWRSDGTLLYTFPEYSSVVNSVSFSPDGQFLASGSFDNTVTVWRVSDKKLVSTLKEHKAEVLTIAWSHRGQILASADADGVVKLWKVPDGKLIKSFQGNTNDIYSISFSPDDQFIATGSVDKIVNLWKINDASLVRSLKGHTHEIYSVAFSPDGKLLASAGADKTIKFWNPLDGKLIKTIPAHSGDIKSINFSSDSLNLVSAGLDNSIKLWKTQDFTPVQTILGHALGIYGVTFSPDSQKLISASGDSTVRIWQRNDNLLKTLVGHQGEVYSVKFSPQGDTLASSSEDTTIKIWLSSDGSLFQTFPGRDRSPNGHSQGVYQISFSSDGKILASASAEHYIKLWRMSDGYMIKTLEGHEDAVNTVNFSPDGKLLASGSRDGIIKLWRVSDRTNPKTILAHKEEIFRVIFSPDGNLLVSASRDKTVKIWRVSDGELLQTLDGHTNAVTDVSFNSQGNILASSSLDKTIKLWRLKNGSKSKFETRPIQNFTGHTDGIWGITFSPNGKIIASASGDKTVKLWSLDGVTLTTLSGHRDTVLGVSFSPDGKKLASASFDGTTKIWRLNNEQLQTSDLNHLLVSSCRWLDDYLKTNPTINVQERDLCLDVADRY